MSTPTLYTIAELEWSQDALGNWFVYTSFGTYFIYQTGPPEARKFLVVAMNDVAANEHRSDDLKAAKQWAQEHFEERMKHGLKEYKG